MQNLGTKAGEIIPSSDKKVAGGPISPLVVSDHMSYGSFSGADIKVIAHYPQDTLLKRIITQARQDQEIELANAESRFWRDREKYTVEQFAEAVEELDILRQQINSTDKDLEDVQNLPTAKTLGEIQTFSWSIFREKSPVRTLGSVYPRAFTRGPRSISGTMIFTIFNEHVFHELMRLNLRYYNTGTSDFD